MKRKVTAFPPAPGKAASLGSCSVAPTPSACALPKNSTLATAPDLDAIRATDLAILLSFLPERHAYSLELAEQLPTLVEDLNVAVPEKVTVLRSHVVSAGLLELELQLNSQIGDTNSGTNISNSSDYSFSSWTVRIGGEGPGLEHTGALANTQHDAKAPVAVRITVPISHALVDDIGYLDNAVWSMLPEWPSLVQIVTMIVTVLSGPVTIDSNSVHTTNNIHSAQNMQDAYNDTWYAAQRHTSNKYALMHEYVKVSEHAYLLGNRLTCDATTITSWLQPQFVHMVANLKAALFEAAFAEGAYHNNTGGNKTSVTSHNSGDDSGDDVHVSALMNYHNARKVAHIWRTHVTENSAGIYSFDMFTPRFCNTFIDEMAQYEHSSLPRRRPNTMNNYGLIMNDIGMHGLMTHLMDVYLVPLVQVLFCDEPVAYGLDHHHSFIVQYKRSSVELAGADAVDTNSDVNSDVLHTRAAPATVTLPPGDKGLDMHHDSSEVTVNICLGKEGFTGGGLRFCGLAGTPQYRKLQYTLQHVLGRAVVHLGRHRHGADDLLPPVSSGANINTTTATDTSVTTSAVIGTADAATATTTIAADAPTATTSPTILIAERLNLIMWLRSSAFRGAAAYGHIHPDGFPRIPEPKGFVPDLCCLSKFNDSDYVKQVEAAAVQHSMV